MPVIRREQVAPRAVAVGVIGRRAADLFALDVARSVDGALNKSILSSNLNNYFLGYNM